MSASALAGVIGGPLAVAIIEALTLARVLLFVPELKTSWDPAMYKKILLPLDGFAFPFSAAGYSQAHFRYRTDRQR